MMKTPSFRQWIAYIVMATVLSNTIAPLGVCQCEGCGCANNVAQFQADSRTADKKDGCCCCQSAEVPPIPDKLGCCGSSETPCSCSCSDVQKSSAIVSPTIASVKRPDIHPHWNTTCIASAAFAPISKVWGYSGSHRLLSPPHVSLHVFLCVFLN